MGLHWKLPLAQQEVSDRQKKKIGAALDSLAIEVLEFMEQARALGKFVIVTLAKTPWVMLSCDNFFPSVASYIRKHEIPIIYSQELDYSKLGLEQSLLDYLAKPPPQKDSQAVRKYWTKKKQ